MMPRYLFLLNVKLMVQLKWYRKLQHGSRQLVCKVLGHKWMPLQYTTGSTIPATHICDRCNLIEKEKPLLLKMWLTEPVRPE